MGNHGYITIQKDIVVQDLEKMLKEIVEERFQNKIYVDREDGDFVSIYIKDKKGEEHYVTGFFLGDGQGFNATKSNQIEYNHTSGDHFWWIEMVLADHLAYRYNGMMSDTGVGGKWKPDINKYKTYREWAEYWNRGSQKRKPHLLERAHVNSNISYLVKMYGDIFADGGKNG